MVELFVGVEITVRTFAFAPGKVNLERKSVFFRGSAAKFGSKHCDRPASMADRPLLFKR